jgi:predicted heme/steroid binding protein
MKQVILGVVMLTTLSAVGFTALREPDDSTTPIASTATSSSASQQTQDTFLTETPDDAMKSFTTSEVAKHASEDDCWTIINGNVYDITSYVPRHPGGDDILLACGSDGSSLFNSRTTEDGEQVGSGSAHSSNASSQLAALQIGIIAE